MILYEKENKVGHLMRATLEKSKFCSWPKKCEFKVNFGIGVIDKHLEVAQLALDYNVVSKPTSVSHEYGDRKWVGYGKFCDAIKDDPTLYVELAEKITEARNQKLEEKLKEQEAKNAAREAEPEAKKRGRKASV